MYKLNHRYGWESICFAVEGIGNRISNQYILFCSRLQPYNAPEYGCRFTPKNRCKLYPFCCRFSFCCDIGAGSPELGYVSLSELATVRGQFGLPIERDRSFEGEYPISVYAIAARMKQRIITNDIKLLAQIAHARKEE